MPFVLATDALVWLLVVMATGYALYCRRHVHLAVPWRRVFQSPAAMASAVVLAVFLAIGLVDSLHFRPQLEQKAGEPKAYATEVLSLLDLGLSQNAALEMAHAEGLRDPELTKRALEYIRAYGWSRQ